MPSIEKQKTPRFASLFQEPKLYGILDMAYVTENEMMQAAMALLEGGVSALQLRAKKYSPDGVAELLIGTASSLPTLCRKHSVPFIINDFPELAARFRADGVHLGQDDGSLASARAIIGEKAIVGRSTHSPAQAMAALEEGIDYIGYGPLFPTDTKKGRPAIGLEGIAEVQERVGAHIPVFCIGGIHLENLEKVLASGAQAVVIVSAFLKAKNIKATTQKAHKILTSNS